MQAPCTLHTSVTTVCKTACASAAVILATSLQRCVIRLAARTKPTLHPSTRSMRRAASLLQRTTRRTSFLTTRPTANLRAPLAFSLPDNARPAPRGPLDVAALLEKPATIEMPRGQVDQALKKKCDEIEAEAKEINGSKEPTIRPGYVVPAAPGTRGKFELVTPEMLHTASAHMMSFLSGTKFTSCQFYCGWCVTRATPYMLYNTLLS